MKRSRDNRKFVRVQTAKPQSVARRLFNEIQPLVETVRSHVARNVNAGLVILYWKIGALIRKDILGQERGEYGKQIVQTLSGQLSWSHFLEIVSFEDSLQRDFYAEMCRTECWSVRTLREKIQGMLYERTSISRKPAKLVRQELKSLREDDKLTPDLVFRDPYLLGFLGLKDTYRSAREQLARRSLPKLLRSQN
jgi:hypothetical protein